MQYLLNKSIHVNKHVADLLPCSETELCIDLHTTISILHKCRREICCSLQGPWMPRFILVTSLLVLFAVCLPMVNDGYVYVVFFSVPCIDLLQAAWAAHCLLDWWEEFRNLPGNKGTQWENWSKLAQYCAFFSRDYFPGNLLNFMLKS